MQQVREARIGAQWVKGPFHLQPCHIAVAPFVGFFEASQGLLVLT